MTTQTSLPRVRRSFARHARRALGQAFTSGERLTGKYPARLLLTDWLPSGRWNPKAKLREGRFIRGLPIEEFTLAEALREAGYRTASIGKWHLGSEPFSLPEHHGFDVNIAGKGHVEAASTAIAILALPPLQRTSVECTEQCHPQRPVEVDRNFRSRRNGTLRSRQRHR